jgi:aminoglycoside phosphotransferase family enzyme
VPGVNCGPPICRLWPPRWPHFMRRRRVPERLQALRDWTQAQHQKLAALMRSRKMAGLVRECHADLHLANLVLIGEQVQMFDCLEFNEDLRWIDVSSDIAFPYVDLLARKQGGLANWFVNEVLSHSGDYEAVALLRFYGVYRALVRAKVAAIRLRQAAGDSSGVLAYVALAERQVAGRWHLQRSRAAANLHASAHPGWPVAARWLVGDRRCHLPQTR